MSTATAEHGRQGKRRTTILAALGLLACLAFLSCATGSKDQVLGTWMNLNPRSNISRMDFREDNTLSIQLQGLQLHGLWKVINKYRVKVRLEAIPGKTTELETLFALTDSTLVWHLPDGGGTEEFKRTR